MAQSDLSAVIGELVRLSASADWVPAIDLARLHFKSARDDALFMDVVELLCNANQLDAAEMFLSEALNRWPENLWIHFRFAEFGTHHRGFDVAAARWSDFITAHPESPLGLCGLANMYRIAGREDDAARLYTEANSSHPDYVWAAHGHASSSTWRRDWAEAARRWQAVRDRFPDHMPAHLGLLNALIEDERLGEAEAVARRALAAFPQPDLGLLCNRLNEKLHERSVEYYVISVFQHLLHRDPALDESTRWVKLIHEGMPEREFFRRLLKSPEYGPRPRLVPGHQLGSYYSPLVDPKEAAEYWRRSAAQTVSDIHGIKLDFENMEAFWRTNKNFMASMDFTEGPEGTKRYYLENGLYPNGDAVVLAGMIHQYRPNHIIEIGSGFSSAVILDTIDRIGLGECHLTCIDPDTSSVRSLLRPEDHARVTIIENKVQEVPVNKFAALRPNDFLFIDSSHVMKTGSDLHYEIFSILPALRPGVIIHFHDIHFPFEYPETWVLKHRWAWNEAYVLRAFLSYNSDFQVIFFTDLFLKQYPNMTTGVVQGDRWPMKPLVGSSIWIVRRR